MEPSNEQPRVVIFGPDPLLSIAIERRGEQDDLHVHAAGQGVWVARMAAEFGASPILCSLLGGETGALLEPLLRPLVGDLCRASTGAANGSYVVDRRGGERKLVATVLRASPQRHEIDDLVSATCAAALGSELLVLCNPFPADGLPNEVYETLAAAAAAEGVPQIVDLSSPRLEYTLGYRPRLVKLNDWELAQYVGGPVDGAAGVDAAQQLLGAGARAVAVTRGPDPILVLPEDGDPYEIVPPKFTHGFREGCGDTMMGAIAAVLAGGGSLQQALLRGAAAGAANFLRHGLGTGRRDTIDEIERHVRIRPLVDAVPL